MNQGDGGSGKGNKVNTRAEGGSVEILELEEEMLSRQEHERPL